MKYSIKQSALSFWRQYFSSIEELDTLLDLIPRAALVLDSRLTNFIRANAKASELTAYTRAELITLSPQALFPSLDLNSGEKFSTSLSNTREIVDRNTVFVFIPYGIRDLNYTSSFDNAWLKT